jgi:hypothetical protein
MPRYRFTEYETNKRIVTFTADNLEHAIELMEEAISIEDLPEVEDFWKNGDTDWEDPEEVNE